MPYAKTRKKVLCFTYTPHSQDRCGALKENETDKGIYKYEFTKIFSKSAIN